MAQSLDDIFAPQQASGAPVGGAMSFDDIFSGGPSTAIAEPPAPYTPDRTPQDFDQYAGYDSGFPAEVAPPSSVPLAPEPIPQVPAPELSPLQKIAADKFSDPTPQPHKEFDPAIVEQRGQENEAERLKYLAEREAWWNRRGKWDDKDWARYYEQQLPLKMPTEVLADPDLTEKYARANELLTGEPFLAPGLTASGNPRTKTEINRDRAQMQADGFDDPVAWLQSQEANADSSILPSRIASATGRGLVEGAQHTLASALGQQDVIRTQQVRQSWREGVEALKDADSWLPKASKYSRMAGGTAGQMAPGLALSAATGNAAVGIALLGGQAGVDSFGEKRAEGWSWPSAALYGTVSGAIEAATEVAGLKVGAKLGLETVEATAARGLKKGAEKTIFSGVKNAVVRRTLEGMGSAALEGGEETLADVLHSVKDVMAGENPQGVSLDSFIVGALVGGVSQVGSAAAPKFIEFLKNPVPRTARAAGIPQAAAPRQQDLTRIAETARQIADAQKQEPESTQPTPTEPVDATLPEATSEPLPTAEVIPGEAPASEVPLAEEPPTQETAIPPELPPEVAEATPALSTPAASPSVAPSVPPVPEESAPVGSGVESQIPESPESGVLPAPESAGDPAQNAGISGALNAATFRDQLHATATSPEEADALYGLVEARAEAAGESVDDYVGKRIHSVSKQPLEMSEGMRQGTLKQPRGEVQFVEDGRAIIRAFETQTVATLAHELGHVFRRDISGSDATAAANWAGAKNGKWTRQAEERFARGFERFLRDGKAPTPRMAKIFAQFRTWLSSVYKSLKGTAINVNISPEMRGVFDRLFAPEAEAAAPLDPQKAAKARKELARMRRQGTVDEAVLDEITNLPEQYQVDLFTTADFLAESQNEYLRGLIDDYKAADIGRYASGAARLAERRGGDASQLKAFDQLTQQMRDGGYPFLAARAEALGNGDIEAGLFELVQGGRKQFEQELTKADEYIPDALEQYHASRSSQEENGVGDRGYPSDWDSVEAGDATGGEEAQEEGQADDFQLANTPAEPKPREFENAPGTQATFITGRGKDLAGQETLFDPDGVPEPAGEAALFQNRGIPPTGVKKEVRNQERADRGADPIAAAAAESQGEWWQKAQDRIASDPEYLTNLINDLKAKPRVPDALETAALLYLKVNLHNEFHDALENHSRVAEKNDPVATAEAEQRLAGASARLADFEETTAVTGSAWGKAGVALQMMADEDYSLVRMIREASASKDRPLTNAETVAMAELQKKLADTEAQLAEAIKQGEQAAIEAAVAATMKELGARSRRSGGTQKAGTPRTRASIAERAKKARAELSDAFAELKVLFQDGTTLPSTGFDPKLAVAASKTAVKAIKAGTLTFAEYVNIASESLGRDITSRLGPYLEQAWKVAGQRNKKIDAAGSVADILSRPPVAAPAVEPGQELRDKAISAIRAKVAKNQAQEMTPQVQELARELYTQGITEREALIDAIHAIIEPMIPGWTRDQTQRSFSGYGNFRPASKDEVTIALADLKSQTQQVLKIEALEARKPLERTGQQRQKESDKTRRLRKIVNELKRKFGVVTTDREAQLRSALEARKTYYTHRMADLRHEIETGQRTVKGTTATPTDAELDAMKKEYDAIKADHDAIFGKENLTDEQRLQFAIKAAVRNEKLWNDKLAKAKKGIFGGVKKPFRKQNSFAVMVVEARVNEIKEQVKELHDIANPKKTPEEIAAQSLLTRLASETVKLREKIANKDYAPKPRKEPKLSPAALKAMAERDLLRAKFHNDRAQDRYDRLSVWGKAQQGSLEGWDLIRSLLATGEFSFVLRQGKLLMFHPLRAARHLNAALRAFANDKVARQIELEVEGHEWFKEATKIDKLAWTMDEDGPLSKQEEFAVGRLIGKVPLIKRFNRAARVFLNKQRWDAYVAMRNSWSRFGTATEKERKQYAMMANEFTGRGSLGFAEPGAVPLGRLMWSPRFMVSRFQTMLGHSMWGGTMRSRAVIAQEYARMMAGLSVYYLILGYLFGDDDKDKKPGDDRPNIELDPTSSDFGKVRIGETRLDPMAGFAQTATYLSRMYYGTYKNSKGEIVDFRGADKDPNATGGWAITGRFLAGKLHPSLVKAMNTLSDEDIYGRDVDFLPEPGDIGPMTWGDMRKAIENHGYTTGSALALLAFFGEGLNHYEQRPDKPPQFAGMAPSTDLALKAMKAAVLAEGPTHSGKRSLPEMQADFKAEQEEALAWLKENKSDPEVAYIIDTVLNSDTYKDVTVGPKTGNARVRKQRAREAAESLK